MLRMLWELNIQIFDDVSLVFVHQAGFNVMTQRGKSLLHARRKVAQYHSDAKADVSEEEIHEISAIFLALRRQTS